LEENALDGHKSTHLLIASIPWNWEVVKLRGWFEMLKNALFSNNFINNVKAFAIVCGIW
jgi:hypothetical protein